MPYSFLFRILFSSSVHVRYLFLCLVQFTSPPFHRYSSYYLIFVRKNIKKVFRSSLAVHYNQHLQFAEQNNTSLPIITIELTLCKLCRKNEMLTRKLIFYWVMHWLIVLVLLFTSTSAVFISILFILTFVFHRYCLITVHPLIQVPNMLVGAPLGVDITLVCNVEASPKAINYWQRENGKLYVLFFRIKNAQCF